MFNKMKYSFLKKNQITQKSKYEQDEIKFAEGDKMSLLFEKLNIQKYLNNFKNKGFYFGDLV